MADTCLRCAKLLRLMEGRDFPQRIECPSCGAKHAASAAERDGRCSATLSSDRKYRYDLWRRWSGGPYCCMVGLNPSTADATEDDPTIRRCVGFAKKWGYSALCMVNLFAFRARDPAEMMAERDPVGALNDSILQIHVADAALVVAAWGVHGAHRGRADEVLAMLPPVQCLGTTAAGHPRHPLYLAGTVRPEPLIL